MVLEHFILEIRFFTEKVRGSVARVGLKFTSSSHSVCGSHSSAGSGEAGPLLAFFSLGDFGSGGSCKRLSLTRKSWDAVHLGALRVSALVLTACTIRTRLGRAFAAWQQWTERAEADLGLVILVTHAAV